MKLHLFLEYYKKNTTEEETLIRVPLSSLVTICALKQAKCLENFSSTNFSINFIETTSEDEETEFFIKAEPHYSFSDTLSNSEISCCVFPCVWNKPQNLFVTGLCSVLRTLIFHFSPLPELLGYQGNCLNAPAEVSTWTKFCEIDLPKATTKFLNPSYQDEEIPRQIAQFEVHLGQPVKIHNIRKRMQEDGFVPSSESLSKNVEAKEEDPIYEYARTQHLYAEGPDLLLSDVILYPHFYLISEFCDKGSFKALCPKSYAWFQRVSQSGSQSSCKEVIALPCPPTVSKMNLKLKWPKEEVPNYSLYKSDPKRVNPSARIFTRQPDIDRAMEAISEATSIEVLEAEPLEPEKFIKIDWNALPQLVHPLGGELPMKRLEKKCQQLENLAAAVMSIYQPGDVIVDFCSGGGHLAILLAYLLPDATVFLVENKEQSLKRAIKRVQGLGMTNCRFYQGNMDYFQGNFDIGVSLHACGVATDLVLQACIRNQASFVSCPCCYGSVQANHMLSYPRSQVFCKEPISFKDYLVLGHTADQTHGTNDKDAQGRRAMNIIDTDRLVMARETGLYAKVSLKRLFPASCTPKNNLIIGQRRI